MTTQKAELFSQATEKYLLYIEEFMASAAWLFVF